MLIRGKIRQPILQKKRRRKTTESGWGKTKGSKTGSWGVRLVVGGLLLLAVGGLTLWFLRSGETHHVSKTIPPTSNDAISEGLESAEAVARAFLKEIDPVKRLQWVRKAEDVSARVTEFPEEARSAPGVIDKVLGHQMDGGRVLTGFVVRFPSGNLRLLEVVGTSDGPRVDWDAYARHGTARWEDLMSGKAQRAVVRVFCEPSTERPKPFDDQSNWTCFRLSSPDLPQVMLGFAAVDSIREAKMKQVILGTPNYRQRFTLEIVRHEGKDELLFEIVRCLSVGWIVGEQNVEDEWKK